MVKAAVLRDKQTLAAEALAKQQQQLDSDSSDGIDSNSSDEVGEDDITQAPPLVDLSSLSSSPVALRKVEHQRIRAAAVSAALRTADWTNTSGFTPLTASSSGVPSSPPLDAAAATGPGGRVLVAANSVVQVHDGSGTLEKAVRLAALFQPVIAEFSAHNVQRAPSVLYDKAEGRFLLAAASHDTGFRDVYSAGRLLLGVSAESNPMMLWRVVSMPAPPCEPGLYAQLDLPAVSHSKYGVFVSMVLRCYDPASRALKYSAARVLALDKAALYNVAMGITYVPYWAPNPNKVTHLTPARPQQATDINYGGVSGEWGFLPSPLTTKIQALCNRHQLHFPTHLPPGATVFVGQRNGSPAISLVGLFAIVNTSTLAGLEAWSAAKPLMCEAAVDRGQVAESCEPAALQGAGGGTLQTGANAQTYGVRGLCLSNQQVF